MSVTRWRQWSKAASSPMIDSTASGRPRSSCGHVGQALDLADDVVAEVADEAAVQRRQVGHARATGRRRAGPRRRRGCPGRAGTSAASAAVDLDVGRRGRRAWPRGGGRRTTSGSSARRARPTRAGSPAAVADEPGEGGDRGDRGRPAARARRARRCSRAARAWNSSRGSGADVTLSAERAVEAGVLAGVAGALALLLDHEQQRVAVAVVVRLAHELAVARGVALAPHLLARRGSRTRCGPSRASGAASRRSSTPSSAPRRCPASCTMAGTRPSAL